jgi:hypothetical protein
MNQHHLYLGKAGQAYVMSQFLVRGWNVAVPEVDIGDDLFVVRDAVGEFSRIQVKTANIIDRKGGYSAQFSLPIPQLERSTFPELTYCFVLHAENDWQGTVVISRKELLRLYDFSEIGSRVGDTLMLYFSFKEKQLLCSKVDLTDYLNNFKDFPKLQS